MVSIDLAYDGASIRLDLPGERSLVSPEPPKAAAAVDALAAVARALDTPCDAEDLGSRVRGARRVAVVVPDASRPSAADVYLLPLIARLARAGLGPDRIHVVIARGLHAVAPREVVARIVGREVMEALRPVQSMPDPREGSVEIGVDPAIGEVRVLRSVAEADLVVLTGAVVPHHLAGFGGGPKALVPGVADRSTILAAHRLTLDALVRPDGSIRSEAGRWGPNVFRDALLRVARAHGRCHLLNVVLDREGGIVAAASGEVGAAHEKAAGAWQERFGIRPEPVGDLVVAATPRPRDRDLIQAHKTLLAATAWARPGAPIVWLAAAPEGPGHDRFLPWFETRRMQDHLAALRRDFHPYGLTAYSVRRIAADHPVHVVSRVSPDILRPMGLLPAPDAKTAWRRALDQSSGPAVVVAPPY